MQVDKVFMNRGKQAVCSLQSAAACCASSTTRVSSWVEDKHPLPSQTIRGTEFGSRNPSSKEARPWVKFLITRPLRKEQKSPNATRRSNKTPQQAKRVINRLLGISFYFDMPTDNLKKIAYLIAPPR